MLSDPFLQLPAETSVRVVWFTDFPGTEHRVLYGERLERWAAARTVKLSRLREDRNSKVFPACEKTVWRDIWRHEAEVTGLVPGERVPYRATSVREGGSSRETLQSRQFTLAPNPKPGTALRILLTSDHQLMPMVAANLQKVVETVGRVDAVFFAGDLVNVPDRASEWFDDCRGGAFFPCLQGRARYLLDRGEARTVYRGGELIQHAPLFPALGNHEVMGRFSRDGGLNEQFNDAVPRRQAEILYPEGDWPVRAQWIEENSFNTQTWEEIFTLPESHPGEKRYYAVTFGDIRLVVLVVANMWRPPHLDGSVKGRYRERQQDLNAPERWGHGQHIFEPISPGSRQYRWLQAELRGQRFQQARYKIVMFHHPVHTLGGNAVPPYTDPVPQGEYAPDGSLQSLRYQYPPEKDYLVGDLMPLLEAAGVQLVFFGHSHLWNRFVSPQGIHFLESSNVGNTYGAHVGDNRRPIPPDSPNLSYAATGDANGLEPALPTLAPLLDARGQPLPYLASNEVTAFSMLDTGSGMVSSYYFDTRQPDSAAVKFDEFSLSFP